MSHLAKRVKKVLNLFEKVDTLNYLRKLERASVIGRYFNINDQLLDQLKNRKHHKRQQSKYTK